MKKSLLLSLRSFACLLALLGLQVVHASWNPAWPKRVQLTLDTTAAALAGPLDNVAVLVRLHTGNFPFLDAKPDGSDLRFIAGDDKTPLKYHIEKFDGINELALVWVQLPRLAANSKTEKVFLYYGNSAATPGDDAKGSYDATQALVMHFSDTVAPLPQDSTANGLYASTSSAQRSASSLIGGGLVFDGSQQLQVAASPALRPGAAGYTVSFWVKPQDTSDALLFVQGEGAAGLRIGVRGGRLFAQTGSLNVQAGAALAPGAWQHIALVLNGGAAIFVNGSEAGRAAGALPALSGALTVGRGYKGELDELQVASAARSADWLKLAASSQGAESKLVSIGPAGEGEGGGDSGPSYIKILLDAVTIDGWIVIAILGVMFVVSVWVMIAKALFVTATAKHNGAFKAQFDALMNALRPDDDSGASAALKNAAESHRGSSLARLFEAGAKELRGRFVAYAAEGRAPKLTEQSIEAIRATVDARYVRETQTLNSKMVLLTISIAGGPFLGLLGTVVGVMITFAAIAAAGDVNVNAIAPGIAAALVATVAGLAVAIPALFGYNWLNSRISELNADNRVFIDEFITRVAENHS